MYVFLSVFFLLIGLIGFAEWLFGEEGAWSGWAELTQTLFLYVLQSLFLLIPLCVFTVWKYGSDFEAFGFRRVKWGTLFKRMAQGFLFYYGVSLIFVQIEMSYQVDVPGYGEQASHIPLFGDTLGGFVSAFLVIVILGPLVEELFFRGYVYQVFKKYMNVAVASAFSALVFALFHLEFQVLVPLFMLGVILNWLFEGTRSLWTPFVFHVLNNAFAFTLEIALYYQWIELPT